MSLFKVSSVTSLLLISGIASALKDAPLARDIISGKEKSSELVRKVAIDATKSVVSVGVRNGAFGTTDQAIYTNTLIVSSRKVVLAGHAFSNLVDKSGRKIIDLYQDPKAKRKALREAILEYADANQDMANVFFSDDVENNPDKANIRNRIVDVIICPGYEPGVLSLENKKHDIAIALLRDPIPAGYDQAKIVQYRSGDPLFLSSRGPTKVNPQTKGDKLRDLRILQRTPEALVENGREFAGFSQADQKGVVSGDTAGGCSNGVGFFGMTMAGYGEIVNEMRKFGSITKFTDNQECLEKGFDVLLAGEDNIFKK